MNRNTLRYILFLSLAFLSHNALLAEPTAREEENLWAPCVEPHQELQDFLRCLAALTNRGLSQSQRDELLATVRAWKEHCDNRFIGLETVAGGQRELVLQLLYFDDANKTRYGIQVLGFLKARNMTLPVILAATVQFLETEDVRVRSKVEELLLCAQHPPRSHLSTDENRRNPDFTIFEETFRRELETVPRGLEPLARHMYATDPEQALRRMANVYLDAARRDELLGFLDEREANEGSERELDLLRKLLQLKSWWSEKWFVQLYVAERVCLDKTLAHKDVMRYLNATEHLIVWQRLKRDSMNDGADTELE